MDGRQLLYPILAFSNAKAKHEAQFVASCAQRHISLSVLRACVNEDSKLRFDAFRSRYVHLSSNPARFELACFERYFAIQGVLQQCNYRRFIMSDTDILLNVDAASLLAGFVPNDIDVMLSRTEPTRSEARFEYSPHFSLWTKEALLDFVRYLEAIYSSPGGVGRLHEISRVVSPRGGATNISDMTLCHLWAEDVRPRIFNSTSIVNHTTVDHNISIRDHCTGEALQYCLGMKRLSLEQGRWVFKTKGGSSATPIALHFQGKYKLLMKQVFQGQLVRASALSAAIAAARRYQRAHVPKTRLASGTI